jgi:hypothetical protein
MPFDTGQSSIWGGSLNATRDLKPECFVITKCLAVHRHTLGNVEGVWGGAVSREG